MEARNWVTGSLCQLNYGLSLVWSVSAYGPRIHLDLPNMSSLIDENREIQREKKVHFIFYSSCCGDFCDILSFCEDCELVSLWSSFMISQRRVPWLRAYSKCCGTNKEEPGKLSLKWSIHPELVIHSSCFLELVSWKDTPQRSGPVFKRKSSKYLGQRSLMGIAITELLEGVLLGLGTFSISYTHSSCTPDAYCSLFFAGGLEG